MVSAPIEGGDSYLGFKNLNHWVHIEMNVRKSSRKEI